MKLKLVGTGSIYVRQRSACSLIDEKILIDCGNGIVKTLTEQGIKIESIQVVLITHLHADHFLDVPFLILTKFILQLKNETNIYCPKGTGKMLKSLCNNYLDNKNVYSKWLKETNTKIIEFDSLENEEILPNYYVTSYLVDHDDLVPAYGFVVKNNDKAIGFSGDSKYCENINRIVENSNISVLDMSFVVARKSHMGLNNIEQIISRYGKKVVATHMNEDSRKEANIKKITNLIVPEDGDEIIV